MTGSQAEVIDRINEETSQAALLAPEDEGRQDGAGHLAGLVTRPLMEFFRVYFSGGGPLGGKAAVQGAVNAWAREFILAAKIYEKRNFDLGKSITESRDFS